MLTDDQLKVITRILEWGQFEGSAPGRLLTYLAGRSKEDQEFSRRPFRDVVDDYRKQCLEDARKLANRAQIAQADLDLYVEQARAAREEHERVAGPLLARIEVPEEAWPYVEAMLAPGHFSNLLTLIRNHVEAFYRSDDGGEEFKLVIPPKKAVLSFQPKGAPPLIETPWPSVDAPDNEAPVSMAEFQQFILQQSAGQGTTELERDVALKYWGEAYLDKKGLSTTEAFFEYVTDHQVLSFSEMRKVASAIGVHAIMIDPLLSKPAPADRDCLVLRLPTAPGNLDEGEGFFGTPPKYESSDKGKSVYGSEGARYAIPNYKLRGTESAFVFLRLAPGASSSQHHHAGDELLLSLDGTVSVTFMDSGVSAELRQHSYVHFYSEQNHSVKNNSEQVVHLFIIRFYQFRPTTHLSLTRQQMRAHLWRELRNGPRVDGRELEGFTWGWILNVAAELSIPTPREPGQEASILIREQDQILNRFGLARFLAQAPFRDASRIRRFLDEVGAAKHRLVTTDKGSAYTTLDDWLWDLESNQVRVPKEHLARIVAEYDVFDLLACEFLFASVPRQVVVRRPDKDDPKNCPGDWVNMMDILDNIPGLVQAAEAAEDLNRGAYRLKSSKGNIHYEIPTRSLACSDVAISWLELKSGKFETSINRHTGCELLIPIEGTVAVYYEDGARERSVIRARKQIVHYNSSRPHRIVNAGEGPATMFVVRFYLDGKGIGASTDMVDNGDRSPRRAPPFAAKFARTPAGAKARTAKNRAAAKRAKSHQAGKKRRTPPVQPKQRR